MAQEGWDFYTIQSFPGLGDDYSATCFAQSMMLKDGVGTSTLGDFNTAMTVMLLTDLSGEPVYYGDLQHIDKANGEIKIIGDGACPPSLAGTAGAGRLRRARHPDRGRGRRAVGQARLQARRGRAGPAGPHRRRVRDGHHALHGLRAAAPTSSARRKLECGIPFWPHGFVTAHCDIDELLEAWNNEYACLGYGEHLYDDLIAFCELTGIKAIAL